MRILQEIYAKFCGYFWMPCPICGRPFGGHELRGVITQGLVVRPGHCVCVCPAISCRAEAIRRNVENGYPCITLIQSKEGSGAEVITHDLKIRSEFFEAVRSGVKRFEIRRNDRGYKVGDLLCLHETDGAGYTGRSVAKFVSYITDFEQRSGFVVMGISSIRQASDD